MNERVYAVTHRQTTSPITGEAPIALSDLVTRIDTEHAAVGQALGSALAHAIAAGEMLIVAKRQVQHGEWRPWLEANCSVPARTARHYMALARRRKRLCDQNGNVLPISVHDAIRQLKELGGLPHPWPYDPREMEEFPSHGHDGRQELSWGRLSWGAPFADALHAVTRLTKLNPPAPRYIVKAAQQGKTPGLTAATLREAIALLTRYVEALERSDATITANHRSHKMPVCGSKPPAFPPVSSYNRKNRNRNGRPCP